MSYTRISRRQFLAGSAVAASAVFMPSVLRAHSIVMRWSEMLPTTHPQVQMTDRIAAAAKEKSRCRIHIQSFPNDLCMRAVTCHGKRHLTT